MANDPYGEGYDQGGRDRDPEVGALGSTIEALETRIETLELERAKVIDKIHDLWNMV